MRPREEFPQLLSSPWAFAFPIRLSFDSNLSVANAIITSYLYLSLSVTRIALVGLIIFIGTDCKFFGNMKLIKAERNN